MKPSALIVGCGDVGQRIALRLLQRDIRVRGWTRNEDAVAQSASLGIEASLVDLDTDTMDVGPADWIFYCAPPPPVGNVDRRLRRFLAELDERPRRIIYLSTSAVYGDCAGRWINEDEPPHPQTDRGRRRLDAEQALAEVAARLSLETMVLRVAGIYGPGRLPVERLRSGQPILALSEAPYSNRVHADDLADAAVLVAERSPGGTVYNVADGNPSSMSDYFLRCAEVLHLPPPMQISFAQARTQLSSSLMSYLEESKRLHIGRLRALGWIPQYPNLAVGLPSSIEG
jgi:nucleoside-diphosphate-sugar epimerase